MNVLWFTNIFMPQYAQSLGLRKGCLGGWMVGLLAALRKYHPSVKVTIVCQGKYPAKEIDGVEYRTMLPLAGKLATPINKTMFMASMQNCIETVSPDIIHFHGTENCLQNYYADMSLKIPALTSIQGIVEALAPVADGGLDIRMMRRYRNPIRTLLNKDTYETALNSFQERGRFEGTIYRRGGCFAGRTDFDRGWVMRNNPNSRYYYVGEILRDEFYELQNEKDRGRFVIFAGAALRSPLKGGHWLIEAIGKLKKQYPDIQLRIAASDDINPNTVKKRLSATRYARYVWSLIKKYDLRKNVVFLPRLSAQQVREELLHASCYCLSSCGENSPNSLGEAMMMKTPVIATKVGGVPSMIDNESGLLVSSCDSDAMADAIASVFENRRESFERAERAYAKATLRFDKAVVVKDLISAYNGVLHR